MYIFVMVKLPFHVNTFKVSLYECYFCQWVRVYCSYGHKFEPYLWAFVDIGDPFTHQQNMYLQYGNEGIVVVSLLVHILGAESTIPYQWEAMVHKCREPAKSTKVYKYINDITF